jgi:hypothetical protein
MLTESRLPEHCELDVNSKRAAAFASVEVNSNGIVLTDYSTHSGNLTVNYQIPLSLTVLTRQIFQVRSHPVNV